VHSTAKSIALAFFSIVLLVFYFASANAEPQKPKLNNSAQFAFENERLSVEKGSFVEVQLPLPIRDVSIGDPKILGVNIIRPRSINIFGIEFGSSKISIQDDNGKVIKALNIDVRRSTKVAQETIAALLPNASVKISSVGPTLILNGTAPSARESLDAERIARQFVDEDRQIINILEVRSVQQVLLKVRIAEMERSVLKTLGVGISGTDGKIGQLNSVLGAGTGVAEDTFAAVNVINPSVGFLDNVLISALEREGLVKTLAEPALTAISGETANFLAGGELPVPSGRDSTGNISVEFKSFGVALSFTPVVLTDKQISLRIKTEVSRINEALTLSLQGTSVKGLSVRRADSTVNLPSGGQIMIAGLLSNIDSAQIEGLPFFKDLPILGALFRSAQFRGNKSELVVIVESYLVSPPSNNSQLTTPLANSAEINALDLFYHRNLDKKVFSNKTSSAKTNQTPTVGN
jgi:pilus assembly protein CpaC